MDTDQPATPRASVRAFASVMEQQLQENDHKGGWMTTPVVALFDRLREEQDELGHALLDRLPADDVASEAADVANFAMMIAEVYRAALEPPAQIVATDWDVDRLREELNKASRWMHEQMEATAIMRAALKLIASPQEAEMAAARTLHYDMRGWAARALLEAHTLKADPVLPEGARRFYRTLLTVEVLTADRPLPEGMSLGDIGDNIWVGDVFGAVTQDDQRIDWVTAKRILASHQASPAAMRLDDDGTDLLEPT